MVQFEGVADARPGTQAPPSTILVVDDNPVNLQLVVRTLDGSGHRILAARNGAAALEIARRAAPDLVLLDVLMPDMNGFDVYQRLNSRVDGPPGAGHLPVRARRRGGQDRRPWPWRRGLRHQAHPA